MVWTIFGSFFGAAKTKKRSQVHRERVARIKHRGGQGCNSDRRVRERSTIYKTEKDHREEIVTSLVVVGNRVENEREASGRLERTSESIHVHSTHTRRRGRNL